MDKMIIDPHKNKHHSNSNYIGASDLLRDHELGPLDWLKISISKLSYVQLGHQT